MKREVGPSNKRLAADIPSEAFWEIKAATADRQLQMRELIPLAVVQFLNLELSASDLGLHERVQHYLKHGVEGVENHDAE